LFEPRKIQADKINEQEFLGQDEIFLQQPITQE